MFCNQKLVAALSLCALALPTQNLELKVVGGSIPGPLDVSLSGGYPFEICMFIPSGSNGPTPIGLIDPADQRSLSVGLDLATFAMLSLTDLQGDASVSIGIPSNPALLDAWKKPPVGR